MNYQRPELRNKLAAEYVLATLKGGARRRFERLLADDRELQALVERWTERLIPVGLPSQDVGPSNRVWNEIEHRLRGSASSAEHKPAHTRWWLRWPSLSAVGGLALGVVGTLVIAPQLHVDGPALRSGRDTSAIRPAIYIEGQLPDAYVAVLNDSAGKPAVMAGALRTAKLLRVKVLQGFTIDPAQVPVLWALPRSGPPAPLGDLPTEGAAELGLSVSSEEVLAPIGELAVSIESRSSRPFSAPQAGFVVRGVLLHTW